MTKLGVPRVGEDNFRVRVARQKRERMRRRLLGATMTLCAERGGSGPLVIDDVVQKADVSRGTFYKYFDNIDAVIEELGRLFVDELVMSLRLLVADRQDPLLRICLGNCALLLRASTDPTWGGFVGNTVYLSDAKTIVAGMREAVEAGRAAGLLFADNVDVAVDFHIGIALQGIRRVVRTGFDEAYILDIATLVISGLGVDRALAADTARRAMDELFEIGPASLPWWPKELLRGKQPAAKAKTKAGDTTKAGNTRGHAAKDSKPRRLKNVAD